MVTDHPEQIGVEVLESRKTECPEGINGNSENSREGPEHLGRLAGKA